MGFFSSGLRMAFFSWEGTAADSKDQFAIFSITGPRISRHCWSKQAGITSMSQDLDAAEQIMECSQSNGMLVKFLKFTEEIQTSGKYHLFCWCLVSIFWAIFASFTPKK